MSRTPCRNLLTASALIALTMAVPACLSRAPIASFEDNHADATAAILEAEEHLIAFRHDLHRHPELSLQEVRTSGKIAEQLTALGLEVRTHVGGYGVVGILRGEGQGAVTGPTIAFRADMDASPDYSEDPVPYAAEVRGVAHNCGHDVHSAIGLALATGLAEIRDTLPGNAIFVFQPAEETGTGARAMIADNVFAELQPDAILAVHTYPAEVGHLLSSEGPLMPGRGRLTVTLSGAGDLGAAASKIRAALNAVATVTPDQRFGPVSPDFIDVDLAAERADPASGTMVIQGLVMSAGVERRAEVEAKIMQAIRSQTFANITVEVSYEQALEGVNNDAHVLDIASTAISASTPNVSIETLSTVIPAFSEDFGSFQLEVPGVMYFLGVNNAAKGTIGYPHTPTYIADDGAIALGGRAMVAASLALMEKLETHDEGSGNGAASSSSATLAQTF